MRNKLSRLILTDKQYFIFSIFSLVLLFSAFLYPFDGYAVDEYLKKGDTYTVTIDSLNLNEGVKIEVSPDDINGDGDGTTPFKRVYLDNTAVTLSAPSVCVQIVGSLCFKEWQVDGIFFSKEPTIQITMNSNHRVTAIFAKQPNYNVLSVSSLDPNSGVPIEIDPIDIYGYGNGTTPFTRFYGGYDILNFVMLTTHSVVDGNSFKMWRLDGVDYSSEQTIQITMDRDHSVVAIYEPDWKVNPANGHRYKIIEGGDWHECEAEAVNQGAHLVTINNKAEQQWLMDTFGTSTQYWIGLTDKDEEGVWKWTNDEPLNYVNWADGEPNNEGDCEDYANMNRTSDGKWNDIGACSSEWSEIKTAIAEKVICEPETVSVSPKKLKLKRKESYDVAVTVTGADDCKVEGIMVKANIGLVNKQFITVTPKNNITDSNGQATFKITAKNKLGISKITFSIENMRKSIIVKIIK